MSFVRFKRRQNPSIHSLTNCVVAASKVQYNKSKNYRIVNNAHTYIVRLTDTSATWVQTLTKVALTAN